MADGEPHSSALDAALRYAEIGWHVFPCKADKTPYTEHGFKDATTDHDQIVAWWRKMPDAQVGIATGPSHLCIIDLDIDRNTGRDGVAVFSRLVEDNGGAHGCGLVASTPRGGRHHVYSKPGDYVQSRNGVLPGIDVKADGGYVVVPSPASPGREWMFGDPFAVREGGASDLCSMPAWLVELVAESKTPAPLAEPGLPASARTRIEVASALHGIPPTVTRSTWLKAIFAVHAALDGDPYGERLAEAWSSLSDAVLADGKRQYRPGEAAKTYRDSTLPEFAQDRSLVDSASLFALARSYGWRSAGSGADDVQILLGAPAPATPAEEPSKPGTIRLSDWEDVAAMLPIEWQVESLIPDMSLVLIAGDTEAGKSFLALDLALRMVHGMPFCGLETRPGSVLYLAGEGHAGLAGRLNAWRQYHLVSPAAAGDRYLMIADSIPVLSAATMPKLAEMVAAVATEKGHAPALVVVDTLSQGLLDGDENDAKAISPVLRGLSDLRTRFRCSVLPVHHLIKLNTNGKGPPATPNKDSIRGSGALTRNVDVVLGLVVSDGKRILHVWKAKDSEKPPPVSLRLEVVETGRRRARGQLERSCVLIPDVAFEAGRESREEAAARRGRERDADDIRRVIEAIRSAGEINSRDEIRAAANLGKVPARVGLDRALRRGLVVDIGSARRPRFVLPDHPEVCTHTPPIPPRTESGPPGGGRPGPGVADLGSESPGESGESGNERGSDNGTP